MTCVPLSASVTLSAGVRVAKCLGSPLKRDFGCILWQAWWPRGSAVPWRQPVATAGRASRMPRSLELAPNGRWLALGDFPCAKRHDVLNQLLNLAGFPERG